MGLFRNLGKAGVVLVSWCVITPLLVERHLSDSMERRLEAYDTSVKLAHMAEVSKEFSSQGSGHH